MLAAIQDHDYVPATALLKKLEGAGWGVGSHFYEMARICSHLVLAVKSDPALPPPRRAALLEQYGARGVSLLRQAKAERYFTAQSTRYLLHDDRDLDPLRVRADFQAFLAEVKANTVKHRR